MARPVGRPRYDTKQKLIAAMRELMAERGYTATSPKMVLERAKLGQGSLYYHFTGKEELAIETVAALMHRSLMIVNDHLVGVAVEESDTWPVVQLSEEVNPPESNIEATDGAPEAPRTRAAGALGQLFEKREGRALVRLLADPTANQPGPLADGIAVWIEALRLLLTEASDSTWEAPVPDARRVAETILREALGQALLQIGVEAHLPR
ncbi:TetR family transcriptional regulator [Microbacterium sp. A82]|uniref:TetR family transcriptional regulator n=1 Tax=Microbacterium sp. A82 TaxID=3450452 RepID=UPI003F2D22D5